MSLKFVQQVFTNRIWHIELLGSFQKISQVICLNKQKQIGRPLKRWIITVISGCFSRHKCMHVGICMLYAETATKRGCISIKITIWTKWGRSQKCGLIEFLYPNHHLNFNPVDTIKSVAATSRQRLVHKSSYD